MESTHWCVITGAPCSGKITVLIILEQMGFQFIPEVARFYINSQLEEGRTLAEIRGDEAAFQRELVATKARIEYERVPGDTVFLDRGMPYSIAYYRAAGIDPSGVIELSKRFRYYRVFLFDRLPLESDGVRSESEDKATFLDSQLEVVYSRLGYEVERIPVASVKDRVKMILASIK